MSAHGGDGGLTQEDEKKPLDQAAHINLKVKGQVIRRMIIFIYLFILVFVVCLCLVVL